MPGNGYLTISPEDIDGCYEVRVTLTPDLPQDRMVKAQLAQAYRTPGTDGRPFMDDLSLYDMLGFENPNEIRSRIDAQVLPAQSPEISKLVTAAREQAWIEANPEVVKLAEKRLNPEGLPDLKPEQVQQLLAMLSMMQAQPAGQPGMAGAPQLGAGPMGGMNPGAMPSQMMMTEQEIPELEPMVASQARRGRPENNPPSGGMA